MPDELYKVVGVLECTDLRPGFGIPVAARDEDEHAYLPLMEDQFSQCVTGFSVLEDVDISSFERLAEIPIAVGSPYIHAFFDLQDQLYLDTAAELRTVLGIALRHDRTPLSTKLMIAEQIADAETQRQIRQALLADLAGALGKTSAHAYESSAVRVRFWQLLERAAASAESLEKIRRRRNKLLANIASDGSIVVDAGAIDASDVKLTISDIVKRLANEFRGAGRYSAVPPRVDLTRIRNLGDPTSATLLEAVRLSPRQEERFAVLLRAVLVYPEAGMQALSAYQDSASFARLATQLAADKLQQRKRPAGATAESVVAGLIPALFAQAYPLRTGELLYYLALHLNDFPLINSSIRSVVSKSRSQSVGRYRQDIVALLGPKT